MLRFTAALLAICAVSSCVREVNITPVATSGSKADGTIIMSYDIHFNEVPTINWLAAKQSADKRCNSWGYIKADAFEGETRGLPPARHWHPSRHMHSKALFLELTNALTRGRAHEWNDMPS